VIKLLIMAAAMTKPGQKVLIQVLRTAYTAFFNPTEIGLNRECYVYKRGSVMLAKHVSNCACGNIFEENNR